jgi:hypothetical protein
LASLWATDWRSHGHERRAPATSPHPSLAHLGQRIRRHTKRYTQQGAVFTNLNIILEKASAPPASHSQRVLRQTLRYPSGSDRLQKTTPHGCGAPPHAPPSVRAFTPAARGKQTHVLSDMSCAANTRRPLQTYTLLTHTLLTNETMSTTRRPPCRPLLTSLRPTNKPRSTCAPLYGPPPQPQEPHGRPPTCPILHNSATPKRGPRHGLAARTIPGR